MNQPPFIVSYSLSHVDWGTVDAIFVSSMGSYLVLPIILRDTGFCGSIYVPSSLHAVVDALVFICRWAIHSVSRWLLSLLPSLPPLF